jgi:hypothetical protein
MRTSIAWYAADKASDAAAKKLADMPRSLYSNMIFDSFSGGDRSRILTLETNGDSKRILIRLTHAPVVGSIQATATDGILPITLHNQNNPLFAADNFITLWLSGFNIENTTFSFQYVKDTRITNLLASLDTNVLLDLKSERIVLRRQTTNGVRAGMP